jgi:hypothetical protein
MPLPRILFGLVSFFGVLAACRCGAVPKPQPVTVTIGDATIPLSTQVCANLVAFCPSSVPDGGETVCESVVLARYGLTPATMPTVLMCEAQALDKATFFACGGVESCGP